MLRYGDSWAARHKRVPHPSRQEATALPVQNISARSGGREKKACPAQSAVSPAPRLPVRIAVFLKTRPAFLPPRGKHTAACFRASGRRVPTKNGMESPRDKDTPALPFLTETIPSSENPHGVGRMNDHSAAPEDVPVGGSRPQKRYPAEVPRRTGIHAEKRGRAGACSTCPKLPLLSPCLVCACAEEYSF